ncbi:MAG TPA: hypothetical protein VGJ15_12615, partial [Pirellulales bacterium]
MQIPVFIESVAGTGFRARGAEPFGMVGEGATPEDALAQFKESVSSKLKSGVRLASVEVQTEEHTWLPYAGMFSGDDTIVQEWLQIVEQQRS